MNNVNLRHLRIAKHIAYLLDNRFSFMGFRFGIDPLLGLLPGIGDMLPMMFSFYVIWIATKLQVPTSIISTMVRNVLFDFIIGAVPVVGDLADFTYKASSKNYRLLEEYLQTRTSHRIADVS